MPSRSFSLLLVLGAACALLAGCGGGGGSASATSTPPPTGGGGPGPTGGGGPTDQQRIAAATATAQGSANLCTSVRPFYWEIGDQASVLASGSVNATGSATTYTQASLMSIASASKWLYAAYVVEKRAGNLTASDYKYFNFESGYTSFTSCDPSQTVAQCQSAGTNGDYTAANDGMFFYSGGHMQAHAVAFGLGALDSTALGAEIRSQLAPTGTLIYSSPQIAGGAVTTAGAYASVLRKMLGGQLRLGAMLGTHAVCTNPRTCPTAVSTPVPASESWHYSIGHWVEDDPTVGDGAFSSAGLFGFYPWIDASRTWYGILARVTNVGAFDSIDCGRVIRKAWATGQAQ
jgi:hypothetical protein